MVAHTRDFGLAELLPLDRGRKLFRGWLHRLDYRAAAALAVGDDLALIGKVPANEHWHFLQFFCTDATADAGEPNAWEEQRLEINQFLQESPQATSFVPKPKAAWTADTVFAKNWTRVWWRYSANIDLSWGVVDEDQLVVRNCDPVWSVHQLPPGTSFRLYNRNAKTASDPGELFKLHLLVWRMLEPERDMRLELRDDPKHTLNEDLHMIAMNWRPGLG